jgi:hypothetical protein
MEVGELAEDDLHHAEANDVGACVLGAVGVVPVPVEAVGLEDSPAHIQPSQSPSVDQVALDTSFGLIWLLNQISTKVIN